MNDSGPRDQVAIAWGQWLADATDALAEWLADHGEYHESDCRGNWHHTPPTAQELTDFLADRIAALAGTRSGPDGRSVRRRGARMTHTGIVPCWRCGSRRPTALYRLSRLGFRPLDAVCAALPDRVRERALERAA